MVFKMKTLSIFHRSLSFQFRNQYDHDVSIWSPQVMIILIDHRFEIFMQGRLYQIEYAMEAVKQGAATVAVKSKTHVVLCALKVILLN